MQKTDSKQSRFTLKDLAGIDRTFPTGRQALLCFVKEDCPTCRLTMPLIEAAHRVFGATADVWAIGQDAEGNAKLVDENRLSAPMLDDSALSVSFSYTVEIVPTVVLAGPDGKELRRFEGFDRDDWRDLFAELARSNDLASPAIDWDSYPPQRPGCGSKSVEPDVAERLEAQARGERLGARRIEIGAQDEFEFMFERGLTDGLPVVPPTPERVSRMLTGTRRDPEEVVAVLPPNMAPASVEKLAANAVMAGCRPEYFPVVLAAIEAIAVPEFNIHGLMATTYGATPIIIVNGPIRHKIGMNMGMMALGYGHRANATIGRAVKLALRNIGGARPGDIERSTLGSIGKFTTCFAEFEERSPWEPLHVERGFRKEENVVTVFGLESGSHQIADQRSRTARALCTSFGLGLELSWHPKLHLFGDVLMVVCPEHADTLARDKWSKAQVRARIQESTARPIRELLPDDKCGEGLPLKAFGLENPTAEQLEQRIPKFRSPENINMIVAGGEAGKFSAIFGGWVSGPRGSTIVSRRIEEVV